MGVKVGEGGGWGDEGWTVSTARCSIHFGVHGGLWLSKGGVVLGEGGLALGQGGLGLG